MRRNIGIVFGQGLAIVLMVGFLIGFSPVVFIAHQAFADGTDDFNDNSKDPALWGLDEVKGQGQLNETNGRLEYTTTGSGTNLDSSDRPLRRRFPYNAPWTIQIDATNTTSGSQWSSFGINVESSKDGGDSIEVELAASSGAWSEFYENGESIAFAPGTAPGTFATIQMSFNNTSKVISVAYWTGASWFVFGTFGVSALGGGSNGNANWGLIDTDYFKAYVFGYSEGITASSGELYGDNLGETGGIALPPTELVVNEGTTGTQIRITGSDFGLKKGKVLLGAGGKIKLKIAKGDWTDDTIIGTVSKVPLPAGSYPAPFEVMIQTKHKPPQSLITTDTFTVTNPVIDTVPISGDIGTKIEITGRFFGAKKGKVYLEYTDGGVIKKKYCKISSWSMTPATGYSTVEFFVPTLPTDVYPLYVSNKKVGTSQAGINFGVGVAPSDRNIKENISPIDGKEVLTRLAGIPVSSWNYKNQGPSIRHIGPMAQDFQAAFNVGESDRFISMVDSGGVALASIQGLYSILQEKDKEIRSLKNENLELKEEIRDIGKRLAAIENQTPK
jgi:hypothetical protein